MYVYMYSLFVWDHLVAGKQALVSYCICMMVSCIIISYISLIIIEIKCTIDVMHLNHTESILPH